MRVVQEGYSSANTRQGMSRAIRSACVVVAGLGVRRAAPSNEVSHYHVAALRNFFLGVGRTGVVLHGDNATRHP